MIIECEKCGTKFEVGDRLIKKNGSKFRCSRCKNIFMVHPPSQVEPEEAETVEVKKEELSETVALRSSPIQTDEPAESGDDGQEMDFENVFEESMEHLANFEAVSHEDLKNLLQDEEAAPEKPLDKGIMKEEGPSESPEAEEEGEAEVSVEEVAPVVAPERPAQSHLRLVILLILLILIGAAVVIFFWAPGLIPDSLSMLKPVETQVSTDVGVRRLKFPTVEGSFVDSKSAGRLFVIQGIVKNEYPESRSFILIKGTILDDKGNRVKTKLAFAGNPLTKEVIEVLPLKKIDEAMKNRYGTKRRNVNVAPGTGIPFTIVFENLPEDLGEFTVRAASSSAGKNLT